MTIIQPSGISGITSITALGNDFNIFRSDGSKALNAGITTDAYRNTLGGLNAGDSFTLGSATDNTLIGYDAGTAITTDMHSTQTLPVHITQQSVMVLFTIIPLLMTTQQMGRMHSSQTLPVVTTQQ